MKIDFSWVLLKKYINYHGLIIGLLKVHDLCD